MKEYWTDENGVAHRILFDGDDYIVVDGDTTVYLEDEDIYDEEELEERKDDDDDRLYSEDNLRNYHSLSLWAANGYSW